MGQRLVIQIEQNGEPLANAYYHWGAYTTYAAQLTQEIREYLDEADKTWSNFKKAVWALYKTGARFNQEETKLINNDYWNRENFEFVFDGKEANRNEGLLCITEEGMADNIECEEARVDIDIETKEVYFDVICIETVEDYLAYNNEKDDLHPEDMKVIDFAEHLEFTDAEWEEFYPKLLELRKAGQYCAISSDRTTVYELIA